MSCDEVLAERIRAALDGTPDVTEKRMFGGVAFLVGGNLAISASGQGGALVRADPVRADHLVDTTNAEVALDLLFGPAYHRLLQTHLPLTDRFARDVVSVVVGGLVASAAQSPNV